MKTQDQLTRAERVRLEALAQAIVYSHTPGRAETLNDVLNFAEMIEAWLKRAKDERIGDRLL